MRSVRGIKPVVCGGCMMPIDHEALLAAISRSERYLHDCGRVLFGSKIRKP